MQNALVQLGQVDSGLKIQPGGRARHQVLHELHERAFAHFAQAEQPYEPSCYQAILQFISQRLTPEKVEHVGNWIAHIIGVISTPQESFEVLGQDHSLISDLASHFALIQQAYGDWNNIEFGRSQRCNLQPGVILNNLVH